MSAGGVVIGGHRAGHGLDLPMGEHRTGSTILEHSNRPARTIHPALGPLAAPPDAPPPPAPAEAPADRRRAAPLNGPALAARHRAGATVLQLAAEHHVQARRISAALREQGVVLVRGGPRRSSAPSATTGGAGGGDPVSPTIRSAPPPAAAARTGIDPAAVRHLERRRLSNAQIAAELGVPLSELLAHFAPATRPRS